MTNEIDSFYFDHIRNDIHLDLIDRDDALMAAPMLVKRLRRLREARMSARSAR